MKYGVIDIGSNSVRLMISDNGKTLYKLIELTQLSMNMGDEKILKPDAVMRTLTALSFFIEKAKSERVDKLYAFATAAVRNANNGKDFVLTAKEKLNLDIEVVSGEDEAKLGAIGALNGKNGGIIDIGGASTEISVVIDNEIVYSKSVPIGAVNITDKFGENKEKIYSYVKSVIGQIQKGFRVNFLCIGGTATSLSAIAQDLDYYDPKKVDGYILTDKKVKSLSDKLFLMSLDKRIKIKTLQEKRAKVIQSGTAILDVIIEYFNLPYVQVSERDNLEGYLTYKMREYE